VRGEVLVHRELFGLGLQDVRGAGVDEQDAGLCVGECRGVIDEFLHLACAERAFSVSPVQRWLISQELGVIPRASHDDDCQPQSRLRLCSTGQ